MRVFGFLMFFYVIGSKEVDPPRNIFWDFKKPKKTEKSTKTGSGARFNGKMTAGESVFLNGFSGKTGGYPEIDERWGGSVPRFSTSM